jgi:hypothetical protein
MTTNVASGRKQPIHKISSPASIRPLQDCWDERNYARPARGNTLRSNWKFFLVCLILIAVGLLLAIPFAERTGSIHVTVAKLLGSSGLFFDIAGIIQLEVSGVFDKWIERYGDIEKYPYGPPSHITRQIIDDVGRPIRTSIRNFLFFQHHTGIGLLILGFVLQLSAVWIWV